MAKGEGKLQAKACAQWAGQQIESLFSQASQAGQVLAGDLTQVADTDSPALSAALDLLFNDGDAWVAYALSQAADGMLLASAEQPVEWYVVTHKSPCAGARTTTGAGAKAQGEALGMALANPSLRQANPDLDAESLYDLERRLRSQGMRGLQPVIESIVSGFAQGGGAWRGALPVRDSRLANLRQKKQRRTGSKTSEPITRPINFAAVAAGAGVGGALAGPVGVVVGGLLGALIPTE